MLRITQDNKISYKYMALQGFLGFCDSIDSLHDKLEGKTLKSVYKDCAAVSGRVMDRVVNS